MHAMLAMQPAVPTGSLWYRGVLAWELWTLALLAG